MREKEREKERERESVGERERESVGERERVCRRERERGRERLVDLNMLLDYTHRKCSKDGHLILQMCVCVCVCGGV